MHISIEKIIYSLDGVKFRRILWGGNARQMAKFNRETILKERVTPCVVAFEDYDSGELIYKYYELGRDRKIKAN